jgi:trans-aconitate methyltransferase
MCVDIAKARMKSDYSIIDVGSALGYTVDKLVQAGFTNVMGVDSSEAMIEQSAHKDRIILSDRLPDTTYNMVIINWTLHFVVDKIAYLTDVFNKLRPGSILVLSEKTAQSGHMQDIYYDFKRSKGVSEEYITKKERALVGVMHTMPAEWYLEQLKEIGFQRVEILNARCGFVTYLCKN